ncbi:MAG: ATP-binding cassette domain-containing protein [Alphaproteobacteria bacterium]
MADAIRLTDVRFAWPGATGFALRIPAFEVARGERLLLVGPSGGGKSTLLSLICGTARADAGTVEVMGEGLNGLSGAARDRFRAERIGVIFQMFNLLPYLSLLDNVLLPLGFAPKRRARAGDAADEAARLLDRLGLEGELLRQPAATLSVGQQQRAAAARALIGGPELVVADEPTSALDSDRRDDFLRLLFEEVERAEATLLMVSHDPGLGERFDRVARLDEVVR